MGEKTLGYVGVVFSFYDSSYKIDYGSRIVEITESDIEINISSVMDLSNRVLQNVLMKLRKEGEKFICIEYMGFFESVEHAIKASDVNIIIFKKQKNI